MENEVQIFNHKTLGDIRVCTNENNEPLFVASDIAKALGFRDAYVLTQSMDDDEKGTRIICTLGGEQKMSVVTESGLYHAVMKSRVPAAKQFRKWVTSEILPTIRKHGAYMTDQAIEQALLNPDTVIKLATSLKEERQARLELQAKNTHQQMIIAEQEIKIQDMTAKSAYCEHVLSSSELVETTLIAQDYGTTATILNKFLHTAGIQFRQGDTWVLYEKYKYLGYTQSKTLPIKRSNGSTTTKMMTTWTQKGRLFLYKFLKNNYSALPIVERDENYVQPFGLMSSTAKKMFKKERNK